MSETTAPAMREAAFIRLSAIDPGVWVPHIPDAPIADSEGSATRSVRRARQHVQGYLDIRSGYRWEIAEYGRAWRLLVKE